MRSFRCCLKTCVQPIVLLGLEVEARGIVVSTIRIRETSGMDCFLQAEIGSGASGERVTVALALSHLGFDPDLEAEHLAELSRLSASGELAEVIVATPGSMWDLDAATTLSGQLVRLLPVHGPPDAA
jgi:hypothetical protein